jgi:riboflavin biosynthesis pyrimidine reductase
VRRLLPGAEVPVELDEVYDAGDRAPAADGRPWLLANMVSSADGAATLTGRSGGLSSPADRDLFHRLRGVADLVLVGASTVRAEGYGPARGDDPPPIAVVSGSLALDWGSGFFTEAEARPIVVTSAAADPERVAEAERVADVVVAGDHRVEPRRALAAFGERGHRVVLCEGGPSLLAEIATADCLDELCLTVAPLLAGGESPRILSGPLPNAPVSLGLASVLEEDGVLFLRYLRAADEGPPPGHSSAASSRPATRPLTSPEPARARSMAR